MSASVIRILFVALFVSSCTLLPAPPETAVNYYRLELPSRVKPAEGREDRVVELAAVRAFPAYASSRIAYRRDGDVLGYYAKHRWVDAPARQLAPLLADALGASGCCRAVLLPGAGIAPHERLEVDLLRFEIDYRRAPAVFRLVARVQRIDVRERRLLASRRFDLEEPLAFVGPAAGVAAANRCVARLVNGTAALLRNGSR